LLAGPGETDKTKRRQQVARDYRVLMLFGDNLRDFDEKFRTPSIPPDDETAENQASEERLKTVKESRSHWGNDWIILPNPVYGEWEKLIGARPLENLCPTTMRQP
jgi:acid phosphatase